MPQPKVLTDYIKKKKRKKSLWYLSSADSALKKLESASPVMRKIEITYHLADAMRGKCHDF